MIIPLSLKILLTSGLIGIINWIILHEDLVDDAPSWVKGIFGAILILTPVVAILSFLVLIWS